MNRRDLIRYAALSVPALKSTLLCAQHKQPEIAFTFDDPEVEQSGGLPWQEINERILAALAKHQIKAILFVVGKRVDSKPGRSLITSWDQAGHAIGNHS